MKLLEIQIYRIIIILSLIFNNLEIQELKFKNLLNL